MLIRRLNEILHTLKDAGIKIEYDRGNGTIKKIMVCKMPSLASLPSLTENHEGKRRKINDGINDGISVDSLGLSRK